MRLKHGEEKLKLKNRHTHSQQLATVQPGGATGGETEMECQRERKKENLMLLSHMNGRTEDKKISTAPLSKRAELNYFHFIGPSFLTPKLQIFTSTIISIPYNFTNLFIFSLLKEHIIFFTTKCSFNKLLPTSSNHHNSNQEF
jgi:hypothetical protein